MNLQKTDIDEFRSMSHQKRFDQLNSPLLRMGAMQNEGQIIAFWEYLEKEFGLGSLSAVMEIGVRRGGNLIGLAVFAKEDGIVIGVDTVFEVPISLLKNGFHAAQQVHLFSGSSHEAPINSKVVEALKDQKLDILFIDGDHSWEGTKKDFEDYRWLVREDGIIAFHDILSDGTRGDSKPNLGCSKYWREIKDQYTHIEFRIPETTQGIGVIKWQNS